ncbi:MAG: DNA ligase [Oceanospirillales bacterium]|nr:DNA ligase [Oceanospirillales bacterium]
MYPSALALLTLPAIAVAQAPALMSGVTLQSHQAIETAEYLVSEKLDGVRARWTGQALLTRSGHRIAAPDALTRNLPPVPLDGELWLGRQRFDALSALVRRADPADDLWQEVSFQLFDLPAHRGSFSERTEALAQIVAAVDNPHIQVIKQHRDLTRAQLDSRLGQIKQAGGEGLMLMHGSAHYIHGRSELLLKYKGYEDAEAVVVGYTEGKGKYDGMTGALIVETKSGVRFRIGSGLSDEERISPPPLGSTITYRYNGLTAHGKPRFARFMRLYSAEL